MERAALVEWLIFTGYFRISLYCPPLKLYCMGDLLKCWVNRINSIEWLGYATKASQLVSCIQVSIAIAANLAYS